MDNLILPHEILNQQVCTDCLSYLSVGPVVITRDGKILCGMCRTSKLIKPTSLIESLYNVVAEKLVFRCINYYEGCEAMLLFNEAKEHQKICKKNKPKCPFCYYYQCTGCQLIQHFNRKHSEYVIKEGVFKIHVGNIFSKNIIFVKKSKIFCLNVSTRDNFIEFFNVIVTPIDLGPEQFRLRFFKSGTEVEFLTMPIQITDKLENFPPSSCNLKNIGGKTKSNKTKASFLLDETSLLSYFPSGWCLCRIELTDDNNHDTEERLAKLNYLEKITEKINLILQVRFNTDTNRLEADVEHVNKENFNISRILKMPLPDLREYANAELYLCQNCVNCDAYITTQVFFCPKYHMSCHGCSSGKCRKCRALCQWSVKPQLNIELPCEWKGCSRCLDIFQYMMHKRSCTHRKYSCPDRDCQFQGCWENLRVHWHMNPLLEFAKLKLLCKSQSIFWRNDYDELFYVCIDYKPMSTELSMVVEEVDVVMSGRYQFLVRYFVRDFHSDKDMSHTMLPNKATNQFEKFYVTSVVTDYPLVVSCTFK